MTEYEDLVQKQLEAYNTKDIDGWLATYSDDAVQRSIEGEVIASGKDEMKLNISRRFEEPDLFAELLSRQVFDNVVIDHEKITRNFPEGKGTVEMLCVYVVENSKIKNASFNVYNKQLIKSCT